MVTVKIPSHPTEITTQWINDALCPTFPAVHSLEKSFTISKLTHGEGLTGQILRLNLQYKDSAPQIPHSLIVKMPSGNPSLRMLLNRFRIYEREILFYRHLAATTPLRTPHCYYSEFCVATGQNILLLEDLVDYEVGNNIHNCTMGQAETVLNELAKLHATYWESSKLQDISWLPHTNDNAEAAQRLYQQTHMLFSAKFSNILPRSFVEISKRFNEYVALNIQELAESPTTLVHGDYRLSNIFFAHKSSSPSVAVIDWQMCLRGKAVLDVAYFIVSCLTTESRREIEKDLLKNYHSTLMENQVKNYEFTDCLRDYRRAVLQVIFRIVTAGALLDLSNPHMQELTKIVTQRCSDALADHAVADLFK